jgi:hypothetical protein
MFIVLKRQRHESVPPPQGARVVIAEGKGGIKQAIVMFWTDVISPDVAAYINSFSNADLAIAPFIRCFRVTPRANGQFKLSKNSRTIGIVTVRASIPRDSSARALDLGSYDCSVDVTDSGDIMLDLPDAPILGEPADE